MLSCKKDECCSIVDTSIDMTYINDAGENLLNPSTEGHYSETKIELFYLVSGVKQKVNNGNLTYPKNFFISDEGGAHFMRVFPNETLDNNKSTTYIEFDGTDTDTLVCEFRKSESLIASNKVWYNNTLVWDGNGPRYFQIKK